MERYAIALKINDGKMNDYRRTLGRLWPEITEHFSTETRSAISASGMPKDLIFIYGEHDTAFMLSPEEEACDRKSDITNERSVHLGLHPGAEHAPDVPQFRNRPLR